MFESQRLYISLETHTLRALVARNQTILAWDERPIEVNRSNVWQGASLQRVAGELSQALKAQRLPVSVSLHAPRGIVRILELPAMPTAMLAEAIQREARREYPIPLEQLYFSWQALPAAQGGHQRVFTLGLPRDTVDLALGALKQAGLRLQVMDYRPLALIRALYKSEVFIVDLETSGATLIVTQHYLPIIVRYVTFPTRAEFGPQQYSDYLSQEIQRTYDFYNLTYTNTGAPPAPAQLYLTGPQAETYRPLLATRWSLQDFNAPVAVPDAMPWPTYLAALGLLLKKVNA